MSTVREAWTDERLDELNGRVENGFKETREEFREMRRENAAFRAEMNGRFDSLQRTLLQVGGGLFATFAVGFLGLAFG